MTDAVCILDAGALIAESPVWCPEEQALYWTDIHKPAVNRLDPTTGASRSWAMSAPVGCLALRSGGGIITAGAFGFAFLDPETGAVEKLHDPEPDQPDSRLNDGRCDRRGRFWAGSMIETFDRAGGALYRFDPNRSCHRMVEGLTVSNGLAWSPDDRVMYHADTRQHVVFAYDYDIDTGAISGKRVFFETRSKSDGRPDGAAVDEEGCYWSARYDGWRVVRHAPDGREIQILEMPVSAPTMCAFGGENMDRLFVTSAAQRLAPEEKARQPHAGGLFVLEVDVRGLPEPRFDG